MLSREHAVSAAQRLFFFALLASFAVIQHAAAQSANEASHALTARAGAALFAKSGCTFCHGPLGKGTDKAPSLRDVQKRKNEEEIYHQIHDGGQMMPPFADALTEDDIRGLVTFLRAKDGWDLLPPPAPAK